MFLKDILQGKEVSFLTVELIYGIYFTRHIKFTSDTWKLPYCKLYLINIIPVYSCNINMAIKRQLLFPAIRRRVIKYISRIITQDFITPESYAGHSDKWLQTIMMIQSAFCPRTYYDRITSQFEYHQKQTRTSETSMHVPGIRIKCPITRISPNYFFLNHLSGNWQLSRNLRLSLTRTSRMPALWDTAAPWLPILVSQIRFQVKTRQSQSYKF